MKRIVIALLAIAVVGGIAIASWDAKHRHQAQVAEKKKVEKVKAAVIPPMNGTPNSALQAHETGVYGIYVVQDNRSRCQWIAAKGQTGWQAFSRRPYLNEPAICKTIG